jgi:hypothetical protein
MTNSVTFLGFDNPMEGTKHGEGTMRSSASSTDAPAKYKAKDDSETQYLAITPKVTLFATALLASCLLISSANAQTVQGKSPGLRTAPAGEQARFRPTDHRLTLDPSGAPGKAVITEATSRGENAGTTLKHGAVLP